MCMHATYICNDAPLLFQLQSPHSPVEALHLPEQHLGLDDGVDGRRLQRLREELADRAQPQQLDRQRQLVPAAPRPKRLTASAAKDGKKLPRHAR